MEKEYLDYLEGVMSNLEVKKFEKKLIFEKGRWETLHMYSRMSRELGGIPNVRIFLDKQMESFLAMLKRNS